MSKQNIIHERPAGYYFFQLPATMDESDLDPYEFRLLAHYHRVGDNGCWESNETTAKVCNMSVRTVRDKRKSLEEKGWIRIESAELNDTTVTVHVLDIVRRLTGRQEMPGGEAGDASKEYNTKNRTVKKKKEKEIPIPKGLDTPEFISTWSSFLEYRKEIRKPMTARSQSMTLKKLTLHPIGVSISSLEESIANGWTGVFPKSDGKVDRSFSANGVSAR